MDSALTVPGADFAQRVKPIVIGFDAVMFRTHSMNRGPVFYGKSRGNRFDAPDGSYGVFYAGADPFCAFIETFARAAGSPVVTTTELKKKALSELKAARTLRLVDLTQSGALLRIGADARLFSGVHRIAQLFSKALHEHPCEADGILYPSRLDHLRHSIVLFEDRAPKLIELNRQSWYAPGPLRMTLAQIMDHYNLELIENRFVPRRKPAARVVQDEFWDG